MAGIVSGEALLRSTFGIDGGARSFRLPAGLEGEAELAARLGRPLRVGALRWPASFPRPLTAILDSEDRLFLVDSRLGDELGPAPLSAKDRDLVLSYLYGKLAPSFTEAPAPWLEAMACLYGLVVLEGLDARILVDTRGPACVDAALSARLAFTA